MRSRSLCRFWAKQVDCGIEGGDGSALPRNTHTAGQAKALVKAGIKKGARVPDCLKIATARIERPGANFKSSRQVTTNSESIHSSIFPHSRGSMILHKSSRWRRLDSLGQAFK